MMKAKLLEAEEKQRLLMQSLKLLLLPKMKVNLKLKKLRAVKVQLNQKEEKRNLLLRKQRRRPQLSMEEWTNTQMRVIWITIGSMISQKNKFSKW